MSAKQAGILIVGAALLLSAAGLRNVIAECAVISAGAETDSVTASVQNLGQVIIGRASNGSVTMHAGVLPCLTACPGHVAPDLDRDCDVDLQDFAILAGCLSGATVPHDGSATCAAANFDADNDVDADDFARYQRCYSGPNKPAILDCAN